MPNVNVARAASAMQCSAGELRAGPGLKKGRVPCRPLLDGLQLSRHPARRGAARGWNGGRAREDWWWWSCRAELGVGCPRLRFACGVIPGRGTAERTRVVGTRKIAARLVSTWLCLCVEGGPTRVK